MQHFYNVIDNNIVINMVMGYTLLEAICAAIGAQTTWITRGGGLCASCTDESFQVLKLLDFSSFEDVELIPWDKSKETSPLQAPLPHQPRAFAF